MPDWHDLAVTLEQRSSGGSTMEARGAQGAQGAHSAWSAQFLPVLRHVCAPPLQRGAHRALTGFCLLELAPRHSAQSYVVDAHLPAHLPALRRGGQA